MNLNLIQIIKLWVSIYLNVLKYRMKESLNMLKGQIVLIKN